MNSREVSMPDLGIKAVLTNHMSVVHSLNIHNRDKILKYDLRVFESVFPIWHFPQCWFCGLAGWEFR